MTLKQLIIETGLLFGANYTLSQDLKYSLGATAIGTGCLGFYELTKNAQDKQLNKKLKKQLEIKELEKIPTKRKYISPLITGTIIGVSMGLASNFTSQAMPYLEKYYPTTKMYEKSLETTKKGKENSTANGIIFGIIAIGIFIRIKEKYDIDNPLHDNNRQNEVEVIKKLSKLSNNETIERALYEANNINYKTTKEVSSNIYLINQAIEEKDIVLKENILLAKEELEKILSKDTEKEAYHNFVKSTYLPFNDVKAKLMTKAYNSKHTTIESRKIIKMYNNKRK